MRKIKNFWQKGWWSKFVLIGSVFFFFFTVIGLFSSEGGENIKKGIEEGKSTGSLSSPSISPESYILDQELKITVHPTKIAKNYTIVYMTTNFDKNSRPYNDIFVVPNNISQT